MAPGVIVHKGDRRLGVWEPAPLGGAWSRKSKDQRVGEACGGLSL